MFSSFFGKRRSSPVEDDTPPIPGPKADDGFVIVDPSSPRGGLYPSVSGGQYPLQPAPVPPVTRRIRTDQTFHYLQGVPFSLSKDIQMSTNKEAIATETSDLLAFLTSQLNMSSYNYDFSVERSVLKEC